MLKDFDIEERTFQAIRNFESGYNCAQSVFLAYADLYEIDRKTAEKMSVSFGGGIGRMREVCGVVSTMAMLVGFRYPVEDVNDIEARTRNYRIVQKTVALFKEKHQTILCRELLPASQCSTSPVPSVRTETYYSTRPCGKYVGDAAAIAGQMLKGLLDE